MKRAPTYARSIILVLAGIVIGAGGTYVSLYSRLAGDTAAIVDRQGGYPFINPLLSCDVNEDTPSGKLSDLRAHLKSEAAKLVKSGKVSRVAIYMRDMDYGDWTGVNESESFAPASLMKVPLMLAYLSEARTDPTIMTNMYSLNTIDDANAGETFKPVHPLTRGNWYSVEELMKAMIEQSDNNATAVLLKQVPQATFADVFDAFGVPAAADQNADSISPKQYMRFFRIVYNGTYLGRTRSVLALQMLSNTTFNAGIAAGLPEGIALADKFGERTLSTETGVVVKRQLSDCGIVYYPRSPYGICVMTEGDDFGEMASAIARISEITYQKVDEGALRE